MADPEKYSLDWKSGFNWSLLLLFSLSAGVSAGVSILLFNIMLPALYVFLEPDSFWALLIGLGLSFTAAFLLLGLANKAFTVFLRGTPGARRPGALPDRQPSIDRDPVKSLEALVISMGRRRSWSIEGLTYIFSTTFVAIFIGEFSAQAIGIEPAENTGLLIALTFPIVTVRGLHELLEDFGRYRHS